MINESTLPIFRVAGYSQTVANEQALHILPVLQQKWQDNPPALSTFSQTWYAVYQYPDEFHTKITFGKLVSTDATLPENVCDAWIASQNYAVFALEKDNRERVWASIQNDDSLKRRFLADLEIYPTIGVPSLYIGLESDVCIIEE